MFALLLNNLFSICKEGHMNVALLTVFSHLEIYFFTYLRRMTTIFLAVTRLIIIKLHIHVYICTYISYHMARAHILRYTKIYTVLLPCSYLDCTSVLMHIIDNRQMHHIQRGIHRKIMYSKSVTLSGSMRDVPSFSTKLISSCIEYISFNDAHKLLFNQNCGHVVLSLLLRLPKK